MSVRDGTGVSVPLSPNRLFLGEPEVEASCRRGSIRILTLAQTQSNPRLDCILIRMQVKEHRKQVNLEAKTSAKRVSEKSVCSVRYPVELNDRATCLRSPS